MHPQQHPVLHWTLGLCATALLTIFAHAQSPTPSPSASPALTGSAGVSPTPAVSGTALASPTPATIAAASPTPSLLKKVGVKIMFIPPPMEGTISLGIYDAHGKLVRVLHKAATADEFVAALDGFITHWDGLDDAGKPMPPGRYDARGYMVGAVKVSAIDIKSLTRGPGVATTSSPSPAASPLGNCGTTFPGEPVPGLYFPYGKPFTYEDKIHVSLVDNPLDRDRAGSADLMVDIDSASRCWLELADGLPLMQISPNPFDCSLMDRPAPGKPLIVILEKVGSRAQAVTITNISDMMAFDCGSFDFAGVGKW